MRPQFGPYDDQVLICIYRFSEELVLQQLDLTYFSNRYQAWTQTRQENGELRRVKIALIDTGVLALKPSNSHIKVAKNIERGVSFVDKPGAGGGENLWWLPTDSHGTHMARLIYAIDPFCELYVAKVADKISNVGPEEVAKVLISITFTVDFTLIPLKLLTGPSIRRWTSFPCHLPRECLPET